jgi:hypothetical protein
MSVHCLCTAGQAVQGVPVPLGPTGRGRRASPDASVAAARDPVRQDLRADAIPVVVHRDLDPDGKPAEIEIRWSAARACVVVVRGRPTRALLTETRNVLWSWSPQDSLTVDVRDAVLTRELFATLIAGRRRLRANGLFEIVGLDVGGAHRIADRPRRRRPS